MPCGGKKKLNVGWNTKRLIQAGYPKKQALGIAIEERKDVIALMRKRRIR